MGPGPRQWKVSRPRHLLAEIDLQARPIHAWQSLSKSLFGNQNSALKRAEDYTE
jgi:hypothetical protein